MSDPDQARTTDADPRATGYTGLVRAVPGLTRIAAVAWLRTAEWSVETSLRAGSRVLRAAVAGESPADLFQDASAELRELARRLLEITGPEGDGVPSDEPRPGATEAEITTDGDPSVTADGTTASLRERGAELLRRSAEVGLDEDAHPAFGRILDQLAPDEGRILRLLAIEGPQAAVDVRTSRLRDPGSGLVAPGLNMLDAAAGCRHADRVTMYLDNLNRLGLVAFSKEPLSDVNRYQLLESQPHVAQAMDQAGRARTVRRSIRLTPFGRDFCDTCLPLTTAELDELPARGGEPEAGGPNDPFGAGRTT
jgi:abortive infection alpha-like protein